ncbi:unnamed protein product, partial [Effrenium voratum]
ACPGITLVTLEGIWDLEGQGVLLPEQGVDGEEEQFMEVLPDEAPLEALVIGFPGDRATGDEAASDPETVVPDERTATHEKKGESEDQTEQAANPRKSAFKATDVVQPKVKAAKIEPKVRVVPPESARVRDPAEEERVLCVVGDEELHHEDEVLELPYDEQQAETMIEHDHQLTGDVEAEQGFQSSEGDSELLYYPVARGEEPQLAESDLQAIDDLAKRMEVDRLMTMGVLKPISKQEAQELGLRTLSTKFVTT